MSHLLVVGAGLTGLSAAIHACERGWTVTVLEQGAQPGGRLATDDGCDTGAQFFSVRDPAFAKAVAGWAAAGVVRQWSTGFPVLTAAGLATGEDGHGRWCAVDGMGRLAAHLAVGLDVRLGRTVTGLRIEKGRWFVDQTPADAVLLTQPVPGMLTLVQTSGIALPPPVEARLLAVRYDPCICLTFDVLGAAALLPEPGGVRIDDPASPVSWIASQRRKGLRRSDEALIAHFRGPWSATYLETSDADLIDVCHAAVIDVLDRLHVRLSEVTPRLRRWRHSLATVTVSDSCLRLDVGAPLLLAGDAFGDKPRMEGAWLSGRAAALSL